MINLNASFSGNSTAPTTDYPYGSARNVTVSGDNTGTPFIASLQNDIIGLQQYLLQEAGVVPSNSPDNATTSQQFESMWKVFNKRTFTKNIAALGDYILTARENLKTRIVITDTTPILVAGINIIVDNTPRSIIAVNNTLQPLTFKTAAGTGIVVAKNSAKLLYCNGTNIIEDVYDIKPMLNATGDAPIYAARTFLNMQGTGSLLIRSSGNVSSLTDAGVGNYVANLIVPFVDTWYAITASASTAGGTAVAANCAVCYPAPLTTNTVRICTADNSTDTAADVSFVNVSLFR